MTPTAANPIIDAVLMLLLQSNMEFKTVGGGGLLLAIICALIAPGRGRSALAWFFLGLLFNCIALVILLLLPDLKAEDDAAHGTNTELRRLREQLKKERMVADERHGEHGTRLDAHDRALGIDTAPPPLPPPSTEPLPAPADTEWFVGHDGDRFGPLTVEQIRQLRAESRLDDSTLVWRQGMAEWVPITDLPELG